MERIYIDNILVCEVVDAIIYQNYVWLLDVLEDFMKQDYHKRCLRVY